MQENEFIYYLSGFLQGNGLQEISEKNFINLKDKLDSVQNKGNFCLWLDGCFAFNNTKYIKEENVCIIFDKVNEFLNNINKVKQNNSVLKNKFNDDNGFDPFSNNNVMVRC